MWLLLTILLYFIDAPVWLWAIFGCWLYSHYIGFDQEEMTQSHRRARRR